MRTHEARYIAEAWLKDTDERDPDKMVNEKRMAAMLLLAIDEIERLRGILSRIEAVQGCECDSYEGHRCVLCRVREMAREGRAE